MSTTKQITVWCDYCSEWDQMTAYRKKDAERDMLAKGWKKLGVDEHICNVCIKKGRGIKR